MRASTLLLMLLLFFGLSSTAWAQATTPAPASAAPAASATATQGSNLVTLPSDDSWYTSCWICPLLQLAEDVRQDYGKRAFTMIGGQLSDIVSVVLILWLLIQVAKLFSPFGGQPSKVPTALSNKSAHADRHDAGV